MASPRQPVRKKRFPHDKRQGNTATGDFKTLPIVAGPQHLRNPSTFSRDFVQKENLCTCPRIGLQSDAPSICARTDSRGHNVESRGCWGEMLPATQLSQGFPSFDRREQGILRSITCVECAHLALFSRCTGLPITTHGPPAWCVTCICPASKFRGHFERGTELLVLQVSRSITAPLA